MSFNAAHQHQYFLKKRPNWHPIREMVEGHMMAIHSSQKENCLSFGREKKKISFRREKKKKEREREKAVAR